ncbi:HAMP domain-containing protein [Dyella sp. LX-66]|uniref:ATP-binding protein n=1 Tax=unclassified Dyella TaxID=2634549 RepID=UPI001BE06D54|nr:MULTISPECIES: ATP-binding protein [unclassified Dyella]MBT2116201.1 HAMP domain-containing protein [Dyella sp. LX-1]MBT2138211.1 HAMP domain-containing protein [Dyella sp. LX-66]
MLRSFYKLYLLVVLAVLVSALAVVPGMQRLFVFGESGSDADNIRTTLYLAREQVLALPESERESGLLARRAPLPLIDFRLVPRDAWAPDAKEAQQLDHGLVVTRASGEVAATLPPSRLLLVGKPAPSDLVVTLFQVLAWLVIAVVLFGGLFLWLRPHWLDLERLRAAADRFGEGQLQVRAGLSERSSIAPLARRFDSMAARIQILVSTQNDMIHAISHELRTPIARFGFGLALLRGARTDEERQRHADALARDVAELDQLVAELLSYGALEQPGRAPERLPVHLGELIDSVVGGLALEMELLEVHCEVRLDLPSPQIVCDPRLTARALINLVKNAMRYGHGRIVIAAGLAGGALLIRVDDNGIGIAPDDRKAIFEPFHRLDRSRDRDTGGVGLGLAIALRAIRAQGGELRADDSPLGGARFEMSLPQHTAAAQAGMP